MVKLKILSLLGLFLLTSCISKEPKDVDLHNDQCAHCIMAVSDEQFASQLVSSKGKNYMFDSVECLAAFVNQKPELVRNANLYVSDYNDPGNWLLIEQAALYHSKEMKSPMGLSLFALEKNENPTEIVEVFERLSWAEVREFVHEQWKNKSMSH
jgi:copper chaperone NosL